MTAPYSDDLWRKLLEAYEAGAGSPGAAVPGELGVQQEDSRPAIIDGHKERPLQSRHGRVSRVTAAVKEQLRQLLEQQPELTLEELRQALAAGAGMQLSRSRVGQVVQQLGLRREKISPCLGT